MIGSVSGILLERDGGTLLVECHGVGYLVTVSAHTLARLPPTGEKIRLWTHTQTSENKMSLYGFIEKPEKNLFHLLITVKNVGPSSAMAMLSAGAGPADIAVLIRDKKTASLTKLKGVGKKTADMLVVELQTKCEQLLLEWQHTGTPSSATAAALEQGVSQEVVEALVSMGWRSAAAEAVVSDLDVAPDASLEIVLREALRHMSR